MKHSFADKCVPKCNLGTRRMPCSRHPQRSWSFAEAIYLSSANRFCAGKNLVAGGAEKRAACKNASARSGEVCRRGIPRSAGREFSNVPFAATGGEAIGIHRQEEARGSQLCFSIRGRATIRESASRQTEGRKGFFTARQTSDGVKRHLSAALKSGRLPAGVPGIGGACLHTRLRPANDSRNGKRIKQQNQVQPRWTVRNQSYGK
jgi:hypothetical protein